MSENLNDFIIWRVWDKTDQTYRKSSGHALAGFRNETGAKLGLRRLKEFYRWKDHEFEIHRCVYLYNGFEVID